MLRGIRIYTSDDAWRQILTDLGATVLDTPDVSVIDFDNLKIDIPISGLELKSVLLAADDNTNVLAALFGKQIKLPYLQSQIVTMLYKTGGMTTDALKQSLGYAPDATTHIIDNAIYQLRRTFGHDFIINNNGVYKIGNI